MKSITDDFVESSKKNLEECKWKLVSVHQSRTGKGNYRNCLKELIMLIQYLYLNLYVKGSRELFLLFNKMELLYTGDHIHVFMQKLINWGGARKTT